MEIIVNKSLSFARYTVHIGFKIGEHTMTTISQRRKLIPLKEREFVQEQTPITGKLRYAHILEINDDGNNVKRQFLDRLSPYGITKEQVRLIHDKIIFSEDAYHVWQKIKEQEPSRKKRSLPPLRQFQQDENGFWVHHVTSDEIARVVARTLTSNANEKYGVPVAFSCDKKSHAVQIDSHGLANYLNAVQKVTPHLVENNPEFQHYVDKTLNAIFANATQLKSKSINQTIFQEAEISINHTDAQALSELGIHKTKTVARNNNAAERQNMPSHSLSNLSNMRK